MSEWMHKFSHKKTYAYADVKWEKKLKAQPKKENKYISQIKAPDAKTDTSSRKPQNTLDQPKLGPRDYIAHM